MLIPLDAVLEKLNSNISTAEKCIIIRSLSKYGKDIISPLLDLASYGNREIMDAVAETISNIKDPSLTPILSRYLKSPKVFVRWTVVLIVRKRKEAELVPHLIRIIGLGYEPLVQVILETLHELAPSKCPNATLPTLLENLTPHEKEQIVYYVIQQFGLKAMDITENLYAIKIAKMLACKVSIVPLIKETHHPDYRIREEALKALLQTFSSRDIYSACNEVLRKKEFYNMHYDFNFPGGETGEHVPDYALSYFAIEGLGFVANKRVIRKLMEIIKTGSITEKYFALRGLRLCKEISKMPIAIPSGLEEPLKLLFKNVEVEQKSDIIHILGYLGNDWTLSMIRTFLSEADSSIRMVILDTLAKNTNESVLDRTARLLIDPNLRVRKAIKQLFWNLKPDLYGLQEGDIINRLHEPLRTEILQELVENMKKGNEEYQVFATFWLAILRYEPAFEELISLLETGSDYVVAQIISVLGIYGDPKAIPYLIPYIWDDTRPRIQRKAIESIGSLGIEGIYTLIKQLFSRGPTNPPFLEKHIQSFGGRILDYLSQEIENESNETRKKRLKAFYERLSSQYQIKGDKDLNIIL